VQRSQAWNVFDDYNLRPQFTGNPNELSEQAVSRIVKLSLPENAKSLTWRTADQEVQVAARETELT
jgi:hypothetical protein